MKQKQWKETNFLPDALHSTLLTPPPPNTRRKTKWESSGKENLKMWAHFSIIHFSPGYVRRLRHQGNLYHPNDIDFWSRETPPMTSLKLHSELFSLAVSASVFVLVAPQICSPINPNRIWNNLLKCSECHDFLRCCFSLLITLFAKSAFYLLKYVKHGTECRELQWQHDDDCVPRHISLENMFRIVHSGIHYGCSNSKEVRGLKKRRGERGVSNNYKVILGNIDQKHSTRKCFPNYNPNVINSLAVPLSTFLGWRKEEVGVGGDEAKRRAVWEVVRPLNNVSICQRQVSSSELSLVKVSCSMKSERERFDDALIITC